MRRTRKITLVAVVFVLPFATVMAISTGSAYAKQYKEKGLIRCTQISGTITFNPPLVTGGTTSEDTTGSISIRGCKKDSKKTVTVPTSGTSSIVGLSDSTNSCAFLPGFPVSPGAAPSIGFTTKYKPTTIAPSVTSFSGYSVVTQTGTGNEGFAFPNTTAPPTPTGNTTGSYPGTASTSTLYANEPSSALESQCASSGLGSITITSGTITL
jgi:hypothetical protein